MNATIQEHLGTAESRRANLIIQTVANDAGVHPVDLESSPHSRELTPHRMLAVTLCLRIYGIDRERLAKAFGIQSMHLKAIRTLLVKRLNADPELRIRFERLCENLGERPPAPYSSWVWPSKTVEAIWEAVASDTGLSGAQLASSDPSVRENPYRWLALDLCIRLPEMNQRRLAQGLGHREPSVRLARSRLPARLMRNTKLQQTDAAVSARFGLQPRLEWRQGP